MTDLNFINVFGDPVCVDAKQKKQTRPKRGEPGHFHMGFRVVGHAPGSFDAAKKENVKKILEAELHKYKKPDVLTRELWLATTKKKPIRSKPYSIHEAASVCLDLALKAGWTCVEIMEIKG